MKKLTKGQAIGLGGAAAGLALLGVTGNAIDQRIQNMPIAPGPDCGTTAAAYESSKYTPIGGDPIEFLKDGKFIQGYFEHQRRTGTYKAGKDALMLTYDDNKEVLVTTYRGCDSYLDGKPGVLALTTTDLRPDERGTLYILHT